jgi:uncharacterized membrane protein
MNVVSQVSQVVSSGGFSRTWVLGKLYYVDDIVEHNDCLYTCLRETSEKEPGHAPRFWRLYEVGP